MVQKIGILGAMREEITPILELFGVDFEEIPLGGNVFHKGVYHNKGLNKRLSNKPTISVGDNKGLDEAIEFLEEYV
ncbi:hypothetical protein VN0033_04130 [Helicobacter pylori]